MNPEYAKNATKRTAVYVILFYKFVIRSEKVNITLITITANMQFPLMILIAVCFAFG